MKRRYNCPNCGAPIGYSPKCEYCGTVFEWIPCPVTMVKQIVFPPDVVKVQSALKIDRYVQERWPRSEESLRKRLGSEMVDLISSPEFMELWSEPCLYEGATEYRGIIRLVKPKEGAVDL